MPTVQVSMQKLSSACMLPTTVLTDRFKGSGFTFSTQRVPPRNIQFKKAFTKIGERKSYWFMTFPTPVLTDRFKGSGFNLLNSTSSPSYLIIIAPMHEMSRFSQTSREGKKGLKHNPND